MAVTHTLLTEGSDETNSTSYTTASISPSANKLLIVDINADAAAANDNVEPTLSGCGVTWVVVASLPGVGTDGPDYERQTMFRALGTPTTGVLTITFSATQQVVIWSVCEKGNVDTGGTNGSAAVVQSATSTSTTATCTVTLAAFGNVNNATHGAFGREGEVTGVTVTPGTGFTEETEIEGDATGGYYSYLHTEYRNDNDTTVDSTASDAMDGTTGIAIEIKESSGTGTIVNTTTDALVLAEGTADVEAAVVVNTATHALTLAEGQAEIISGTVVNCTTHALTLTEGQADVEAATVVNCTTHALTLTEGVATIDTVDGAIETNTHALVLTEGVASIEAATVVNCNTHALVLSANVASIITVAPSADYSVIVENQMIAELSDTLFPIDVAVDSTGGVTGLSITAALRDPNNSASYLDWSDLTFKTSGWTTKFQSLTEYGNGFYGVNLDVSSIINFPSAKHAAVEYDISGTVVAVSQGLLTIAQTWQQAAALTVGKFLGLK